MEKLKISKEKIIKIKDVIIFGLIFIWMIMPILQSIKIINDFIVEKNLYFILMQIIGIVGIGSAVFAIYDKFKNSDNRKEVFKQVLPIFIFILYMIWTLNSCHKAAIKKQAFHGNSYRREGYYMYLNYAGFFLCSMLLENKKLRKVLLNTFLITTVFLIIVSRISNGGEKFANIFVNNQIEDSVFHQFNHYGYYLMLATICALGLFLIEENKILKIVYLVGYTLIGYALIYNDTFGCYLATVVTLILYAIYALIKKKDRKLIFIAIIIFTILSCITYKGKTNLAYRNITKLGDDVKVIFSKIMNIETEQKAIEEVDKKFDKAGTNRMKLWTNAIDFISKKPIIGYGPDNLRGQYLIKGIDQDRPHNLIIYLACVSGIPGMLIYFTAVGIIVIRGIKKLFKENAKEKIFLIIVIAYLISSMFGNSMYYTSPYFFIFLGSLMNSNLNKIEEK